MEKPPYLISLKEHCQPNGILSVIEENRTVPFEIRRCFFIYDLKPGDIRGNHAANYEECVFLLTGKCAVKVHTGREELVFELDTPMQGVYIPAMCWREVCDFSKGCVLAVFSDRFYDPDAYVRDFDAFLRYHAENRDL